MLSNLAETLHQETKNWGNNALSRTFERYSFHDQSTVQFTQIVSGFNKYHNNGLEQAFLIIKWLFFLPKQLNLVIFDTGFSRNYFRACSFWYTDLQASVLLFAQFWLTQIVQLLVYFYFFEFYNYFLF